MAEPAPLTTETYTHEDAIARIADLEAAVDEALSALEAGRTEDAVAILEGLFEEECEGPEDEEDEDDFEDEFDELEDDD